MNKAAQILIDQIRKSSNPYEIIREFLIDLSDEYGAIDGTAIEILSAFDSAIYDISAFDFTLYGDEDENY